MSEVMFEPLDTSPDARRAQRDAYRRLGGTERVAIAFRLGALVRETTLAGILRRHPTYSNMQLEMALRRLVLGDELVQMVWPNRELVDP